MPDKQDALSSTEKLLELIRSPDTETDALSEHASGNASEINESPFTFNFLKSTFSFRKKITVGIDIGASSLKLVKIRQTAKSLPELLDFQVVPFDADMSAGNPHFHLFLKSALHGFCHPKTTDIWSAVSTAGVKIHYLKIPKVSKGHIANTVYWTCQRDYPFEEKDTVFDFQLLDEILEKDIKKIEVVAFVVPKEKIERHKKIFSRSDFPVTGITIIPFALQNFYRTSRIKDTVKSACSLFVGRDWARIAIFSKGYLILSRDIKTGMRSLAEAILFYHEEKAKKDDPKPDEDDIRLISGKHHPLHDPSYNMEDGLGILEGLSNGSRTTDEEKQEILNMAAPAMDRLVKQVLRTMDHYFTEYREEPVERVFVSGQINIYGPLIKYMESQLDIPVDFMDPFSEEYFQSLAWSPESPLQRENLIPATGLALSNNLITPNLICTYKEKEKISSILRLNRAVVSIFMVLATVCLGIFIQQEYQLQVKNRAIEKLQHQLDESGTYIDRNLILTSISRMEQKNEIWHEYGHKYLIMAVIQEIARHTPAEIRLIFIDIQTNIPPDPKIPDREKGKQKGNISIEGIVTGDRIMFETILTGYLSVLKQSLFFDRPMMGKRSVEFHEGSVVMNFHLSLDLMML